MHKIMKDNSVATLRQLQLHFIHIQLKLTENLNNKKI